MGRLRRIGGFVCAGALLLASCTTGNGNPNATVGTSDTDADENPDLTINGLLGEECFFGAQCVDGFCLPVPGDLDGQDDGGFETGDPGEPVPPDQPDEPNRPPDEPPGVDEFFELGVCTRECATVFQCPEDGWVCSETEGVCVPEFG